MVYMFAMSACMVSVGSLVVFIVQACHNSRCDAGKDAEGTANTNGKDDVFDPAQLGPKFQAPDTTAAVAWASPLVAAAYRSVPLLLCPPWPCPALRYCCNSSF